MHPWLVQHPAMPTYGVCLVLSLIAAWLVARLLARATGVHPSLVDLLVPLLVASGLAGAWLFGSLTDVLTHTPVQGSVLLGALLSGVFAGILYALFYRIPLGILGDLFAAPMALGIAGGRVGCFFAGCCYGKICDEGPFTAFALRFPRNSFAFSDHAVHSLLAPGADRSLPVYPVQLLESAGCLFLAAMLVACFRNRRLPGEAFLMFALAYSVFRFLLEFLRADNPPILGPLTFSQVACVFTFIIALATFLVRRHYALPLGLWPVTTSFDDASATPSPAATAIAAR